MTNYKPVTEEVLEELRKAVGAEHVKNDAETLERYKTDEEPDAHYHQHRRGSCCYENRQ